MFEAQDFMEMVQAMWAGQEPNLSIKVQLQVWIYERQRAMNRSRPLRTNVDTVNWPLLGDVRAESQGYR